jgi:hypothetical protein
MKIDVDDECIDEIIAGVLIDCYVRCKKNVKAFKKKKELTEYEKEDLEYSENLLPSLDVVGAWFVYDWKEKVKKK